jgi:hypothetical protein
MGIRALCIDCRRDRRIRRAGRCVSCDRRLSLADPASRRGAWAPEEDDLLIRLRNEGRTYSEIAALLSRPVANVEWRGRIFHGLLSPRARQQVLAELAPQAPDRRRPSYTDFALGQYRNNRGWSNFLEDE